MIEYHFIYGKGVASQEREDWHIIASAPVDYVPLYRRIAAEIINPVFASVQPSLSPQTQLLVGVAQANEHFWAYTRVFHVGADASGRTLYSYHTLLMTDERITRMGHQPWHLLALMAQKKGRHGFYLGGLDQEITGANPIPLNPIALPEYQHPDTIGLGLDQGVARAVKASDIKFVDQTHDVEVTGDILEFLTHSGSESWLGVLSGVSLQEAKNQRADLCRYGIGLVTRLSPPVTAAQASSAALVQKYDSALTTLAAPVGEPKKASRPANKPETRIRVKKRKILDNARFRAVSKYLKKAGVDTARLRQLRSKLWATSTRKPGGSIHIKVMARTEPKYKPRAIEVKLQQSFEKVTSLYPEISWKSDSSGVSPAIKKSLNRLAHWLILHPEIQMLGISGVSVVNSKDKKSRVPKTRTSEIVAKARVGAVVNYLQKAGVDSGRLIELPSDFSGSARRRSGGWVTIHVLASRKF